MAQSARPTLARKAITLAILMFMSVMVGVVTAEIPDGNGTTGIDRNSTSSEQDGASITRTLDGVSVLSLDEINLNNGMIMTAAGDGTTGSNTYAASSGEWRAQSTTGMTFVQSGGANIVAPCIAAAVLGTPVLIDVTCATAMSAPEAALIVAGVQVFDDGVLIGTVSSTATTTTVITLAVAQTADSVEGSIITFHEKPLRMNNLGVVMSPTAGNGGGVNIVVQNAADGPGETVTMTLQNWYAASDRSMPHAQGSSIKSAGLANCVTGGAYGVGTASCTLNGDSAGIDALLPTQFTAHVNTGANAFSYGISATETSADLYYGVDYTAGHNVSVFINGVKETIGNTRSVSLMDDVILKCSDLLCTQSDIQIGIPSAHNATAVGVLNGGVESTPDNYNVTTRLAVYDGTTVKVTFGTAAEHQSNITAANGVFYDPSVRFLSDEPGVRIGQIEDGGASWCDSWWFLAKCGDKLSLDGKASDGMDGIMLHYKVPLESMYSQASWGGYDLTQLRFSHKSAQQCYNGEIQTYVLPASAMSSSRTKNSLINYAISGDYYTMTEPTSAYASGTTRVGTSTADYCFGDDGDSATTDSMATAVDIGRIGQMTSATPYAEMLNGFYDADSQMYEFYVIVSIEASSSLNANADSVTDEFTIDTGAGTGAAATAGGLAPSIIMKNTVARNPLQDFAPNQYRSTNSTNQTNPAFASSYVMYYSGITPSDNVLAGRNLTDQDWDFRYMGVQGDEKVRKPTGVGIIKTNASPNMRVDGYVANATTPLSTIECGAAAFGGSMISASINIYTSLDTSLYYGAGQNNSGYPTELLWKEYGTLSTNSSRWLQDSPTNIEDWSVDNTESNTGTNLVSFTGSFINGDNYKATCTFIYHSDDIGAGNVTSVTLTTDHFFTARHDGNYTTGGGSDVSDDDEDSILDELGAYDYVVIGIALALIGLAIYMWSSGGSINSWFDNRLAMMMLGGAVILAWIAQTYGPEQAEKISSDSAMALGTIAYLVMALAAYLWGNASVNQGERNFRFALGGLFLIVIGVPTALTGILNVESAFLTDAIWNFPVYDAVAGIGAFTGIILLGSAAAGLYRRDGM